MEMGDDGTQSIEDCTAGNDGGCGVSLVTVDKRERGLFSSKDSGVVAFSVKTDDWRF
jgi:hypothetical protein